MFLNLSERLCNSQFFSPDDEEEEQTHPSAFNEDTPPTSVTPKLPQCLQEEEEEKESDSDSEGPIQYRDEEDEDESQNSKKRREKQKRKLFYS